MKKIVRSEESGFTLIEVMVVAGLFVVAMVVLMGSLMTMIRHGEIADKRVAAINLNHSTFDFIRGSDWDDLGDFVHPVTDPDTGISYIEGLGDADVRLWAIIPPVGGNDGGRLLIGSEAMRNFDADNVPNPVEIQIEIATLVPNDSRVSETLALLAAQETTYSGSFDPAGAASTGSVRSNGSYTFTASILHAR